ncbi:MAG: bifunctional serine/threonine-protein kinase/formylglycine-generating enzyme family protein [bacterium]
MGEIWQITGSLPNNPATFTGRHVATNQRVLIKRLSRSAAMDRTIRSQFLSEAELLQTIEHEHIIQVLDVVADPAAPAIVMANPDGEPLSRLIERRERVPVPVAIAFALQLLNALDYLHSVGVVHRNLTSDTIHVIEHPQTGLAHLIITDFGLARAIHLDAAVPATGTGTLVGMQVQDNAGHLAPTPYMAPETLAGVADSRADLYALGVLLFELITGRRPIGHSLTGDKLIRAIHEESPTMLRLLRPEVSAELEETLNRLMAKDPDRRFFDVSDARSHLLSVAHASMVKVPAGRFSRGSQAGDDGARPEELPQREIHVSAFFVDRLPVTVAQYRTFLQATGQVPVEGWERHNPVDQPDWPVVYVTWDEAKAYADWAGKRLLTEVEWEKAARGTDGRIFPWGNQLPNHDLACFASESRESVSAHPAGASPYGCMDIVGNAFEWVNDWYNRDYYALAPDVDPKGPNQGSKKVLRGGSFVHEAFALRVATRGRYAPHERRANHGFRCAWSLDYA